MSCTFIRQSRRLLSVNYGMHFLLQYFTVRSRLRKKQQTISRDVAKWDGLDESVDNRQCEDYLGPYALMGN
jgi:hypothetical protein